jgi:hypothetical protein
MLIRFPIHMKEKKNRRAGKSATAKNKDFTALLHRLWITMVFSGLKC